MADKKVGDLWRDTDTGIPGILYVWTGHEWSIVHEEVSPEETVLAARKDDSRVLMQVVEIVNDDTITERKAVRQIAYVLVDYLNIPRCANKASTIIDANIMIEELNDRIISGASDISALRFANIDLEREVAKQKETIDELKSPNARYAQTISDRFDTIKALRIDVADRDRHIKELEDALERRRIRLACVRDLIDNPRGRSFQAIVEGISKLIREDITTLEKIKDVWRVWKDDTRQWRSTNAMDKISTILTKAETEDVKS